MTTPDEKETIRETVRTRYAAIAVAKGEGSPASCCGGGAADPISRDLYAKEEAAAVPAGAVAASLGCGNPAVLAELRPGETVLDLGSGGGVDVLLAAKEVGPTGFVYGLDMTDEMLALAERHRAEAGATNVKFLKGTLEDVPLPDASVDVLLSNCVVNLSPDKGRVLREAFRVLRPGGRFAVADVVARGPVPESLRRDMESWTGCVAGALEEGEFRRLLSAAGFEDVEIRVLRVHGEEAAAESGGGCCGGPTDGGKSGGCASGAGAEGLFVSAFVRARKPGPPA